MIIKSAKFVISNTNYKMCPTNNIPEYAFIGRSNVGKSSLINALTKNKKLAKTSAKPGKTQLINHFIINESWYLVDLPGYGYTKTSKVKREQFSEMTKKYILNRSNLVCLFVLVDSRHSPQKIDQEFMQWLAQKKIPFVIIFTKIDKLGQNSLKENLEKYKAKMLNEWEELPNFFSTSSEKKIGLNKLSAYIHSINNEYN